MLRLALAIALFLMPLSARAEVLSGRTRVVDGDTIRVAGVPVRLQGIAAPELDEPGGAEAKAYLMSKAQGRLAVCELTQERTYGRRVGICRVDGEDLAELVIGAGLARDCPRYSGGRYADGQRPEAEELPLPSYCRRK
jgi:endonuclease YncB( thermonuclease family)